MPDLPRSFTINPADAKVPIIVPVILGNVEPSEVLCFAKDDEGATDIVRGSEHPSLTEWRRDVSLGTLFAAGVLS